MMNSFLSWFWNERFWLPRNVTWADLRNTDDAVYAQPSDLWIALPYSLLLYGIRILTERLIAKPIGQMLNISDNPNKPPSPNVVLERVYEKITKHPQGERLQGLCKQLNWKERQVMIWFHRKRDQCRPTKLAKFSETMWRFFFYTAVFFFGLVANFQTDCPFRTRVCWEGYPEKPLLTSFIYWYYQTELAFYLSCVISQFFDIRRKDFWIMFLHHIATIVLIIFSYSVNFTNIGMLIMSLHDFSDIFLESSKLAKYSKKDCLGTLGLICFAISFSVARLIYFPFWVLNSIYFECFDVIGPFPSWYMFSFWLFFLQLLHILWFTYILKGFVRFIKSKGKVDDVRSESEDNNSDQEQEFLNSKMKVQSETPTNGVVQRKVTRRSQD